MAFKIQIYFLKSKIEYGLILFSLQFAGGCAEKNICEMMYQLKRFNCFFKIILFKTKNISLNNSFSISPTRTTYYEIMFYK